MRNEPVSVNISDLPIVAALFSRAIDPENPSARGVIAPLERVPQMVRETGSFPCRFLLEGYEEHVRILSGRPLGIVYVPDSHIVWVMSKFLDTRQPPGQELWAYGILKPHVIAVRDMIDGDPWEGPNEQAWLEYREEEKVRRKRPFTSKPSAPKLAPAPVAPRQAPSGPGGTAVTKMSADERAEYKARLLAKAVLTDRDRRHLARIEKMEG